ncbi:MAG: MinD/ParA family protein [Thermodesulfobacteriota bacterium]
MDQADGLRTLRAQPEPTPGSPDCSREMPLAKCPRVISVTSGKGGVGKTNVVANLAYAFSRMGRKVLVLDADLGLANIDVLLGLTPQFTIEHFLRGEKSLSEILTKGPGGMSVLPASSGVYELVNLNETEKLFLLNEVDLIADQIDLLLIDTGAGISSNVLYFNMAAQESIVIATPEPTSITDAYALIKVLSTRFNKKEFMILINLVQNAQEAREVFQKISWAADHFLESLSIDYLGFLPYDEKLLFAVRNQRPVLEIYPRAPSSRGFTDLAKTLSERPLRDTGMGTLQFFWRQLLQSRQRSDQKEEMP